eukprot:365420-Chlamydomonas_euryale.AAC.5
MPGQPAWLRQREYLAAAAYSLILGGGGGGIRSASWRRSFRIFWIFVGDVGGQHCGCAPTDKEHSRTLAGCLTGNVNMLADHQLWNRGTSSEQVPVVAKPTPTRASAPAQQEPGPALTPAQRRMGVRRQSVLRLEKCQQLPLVPEGEADKPPHTACSYEGGATGTVPHLAGFAGGLPTQPATGEGALALPADAASGKLANSAVAPPDGAQLARSDSFEFGELAQYNPVRRACVRLVCNPDFELAVTLLIFANCVSLCLYDPLQPDNSTHNRTLFWIGACSDGCRTKRNTAERHGASAGAMPGAKRAKFWARTPLGGKASGTLHDWQAKPLDR